MPGANTKQCEDLANAAAFRQRLGRGDLLDILTEALVKLANLGRDLGHRQHEIDQPGGNRVSRHIAVLGFVRILRDHEPAVFLDPLQARRSVRAGPREHHAGRPRSPRVCERSKEQIDRRAALLDARHAGNGNLLAVDTQETVRRDDVHLIGLDSHSLLDLDDGNPGRGLQHFGEMAFMIGGEMEDDDVGGPGVGGNVREERLQRFDAAR